MGKASFHKSEKTKELIEQKWGHIKNKVKKTRDNFPKFIDCFRLCFMIYTNKPSSVIPSSVIPSSVIPSGGASTSQLSKAPAFPLRTDKSTAQVKDRGPAHMVPTNKPKGRGTSQQGY
ncbi:MAG: hypothetical protein ACI9CD_001212 [Candidatus Deianiraeaceae bacterium]|jgi:hypothetical protein